MSDSKLVRGFQARLLELPEGLLIAVLYAGACWVARQVSVDQFFLPAGIRIAALLVCRPRMWPYLLLGDYAYFACVRAPMVERYGLTWALIASCYPFPLVASLVHVCRREVHSGDYASFLPISLISAVAISFLNVTAAHLLWPEPPQGDYWVLGVRYTIGEFLAIVTVVPLAMLWLRPAPLRTLGSWLHAPTIIMVLALASMTGFALYVPTRYLGDVPIQLLMVLPVIGLAFLHGWRGVAIGVPALNFAVHLSTATTGLPGSFDPLTFTNQVGVALVAATLILFGLVVRRDEGAPVELLPAATGDHRAFRFSQHALEMTLRRHVLGIRKIYEDIDRSVCDLADWLEERKHAEMAKVLRQFASISSREMRDRSSLIYPTALEHVGLYLALQVGGIGQEWRGSHRVAEHQLSGDPCQLSMPLQLAAYRTITETVSLMLGKERGPVRLRARCGRLGERYGVVIVIGLLDVNASLTPEFRSEYMKRVAAIIATYGGRIEFQANRVRMSLIDVDEVGSFPRP